VLAEGEVETVETVGSVVYTAAEQFEGMIIDERWKDRFIIGALFLTVAGFVAQTYSTRHQAMAKVSNWLP